MAKRIRLISAGWLIAVLLVVLSLALFSNPVLPSPKALLVRLAELLAGPLWPDLLLTSVRSLIAFMFAMVLGILWAAVFPPRSALSHLAEPALMLLQGAPVIIWIIPLVLLLGAGHAAPVVAATLVVLPLIAFEFRTAFEMTSRERREFWRHYVPSYRLRIRLRLQHEWRPYLASATGMGLLMSFKASVIAEWFAAKNGIGRQLQQAFVLVDTAAFLAYALSFLFAALGLSAWAQARMRRSWPVPAVPAVTTQLPRGNKNSALRIEAVSHRFGRREVLRGVNFALRSGEISVLTGNSGCGKSTLAKIAAGVLHPEHGSVITPPFGVCLVFQADFLFPAATVAENVNFFRGETPGDETARALHQVGLAGEVKAGDLSGGMRRRLALARGFLTPAQFLILDEPFSGLDAHAVAALVGQLKAKAREGYGILVITHNLTAPLRRAAKRVYQLADGRLTLKP